MTSRRVIVGLIVAAIGLLCVFFPWAFYVLLLVIGVSSIYEFNYMCAIKGQPLEYLVALLGVVAYVLMAVFGVLHNWEGVLLAAIAIAAFSIGMFGAQNGYFARTAYTLLAVLYIGKLLTYFVFVRQIPGNGMWLTLYVIVIIAFTDTFAMLVGSVFGKHQLTKISPNKTVEGSVGSLVLATAFAIAATAFAPLHLQWWQGGLLGVVTSFAAQVGDLIESAFKRDAGVKDAGAMIVGHGGVLDRFDSYLLGGVAFYAMLHAIGILRMPSVG